MTDVGTIEVLVSADPNVSTNSAPVAQNDSYTLTGWTQANLDVLSNDTDSENDTIRLVGVQADVGAAAISDGEIIYTPLAGQTGDVTLTYSVIDDQGGLSQGEVTLSFDISDTLSLPNIDVPADLCGDASIDAKGLYTRVDLGFAQATDSLGTVLPVSLIGDNGSLLSPGVNTLYCHMSGLG
jgi:hypothetical protein